MRGQPAAARACFHTFVKTVIGFGYFSPPRPFRDHTDEDVRFDLPALLQRDVAARAGRPAAHADSVRKKGEPSPRDLRRVKMLNPPR
jgi:hypothetical protein